VIPALQVVRPNVASLLEPKNYFLQAKEINVRFDADLSSSWIDGGLM
jgi:hypothetical protein